MSKLTLYNTNGRSKQEFKAITDNQVGLYTCGPTVYNYAHIGNLRSYVFSDILRRALEYNDYSVTQVINITDVGHLVTDSDEGEDKMTKALRREGKELTMENMLELATFYKEAYKKDLEQLNIETPHHLPRASEHIDDDIAIIQKLEEKDFVYTTNDGVYFDTSRDPHYGELASKSSEEDIEERVNNTEKRNPRDFAVWKFNSEMGWETPWGKGFPGWHIECSGMSMHYLGEHFDIHTGGTDHIPVHHTNEIAQSENATGKPYANYWLHNAFLNIKGDKIAKSEGNVIYLKDIVEAEYDPLSYRYLLLQSHYRAEVNFSWEALDGARNALGRLYNRVSELGDEHGTVDEGYMQTFENAINNDLNTPEALAVLWELIKDNTVSNEDKRATIELFDSVLGLKLLKVSGEATDIPDEVQQLLDERSAARENKDWDTADQLRNKIQERGYIVKDTDNGQQITKQ